MRLFYTLTVRNGKSCWSGMLLHKIPFKIGSILTCVVDGYVKDVNDVGENINTVLWINKNVWQWKVPLLILIMLVIFKQFEQIFFSPKF